MQRMMLALVSSLATVLAHGSGAWVDLKHHNMEQPFSGMRYVSEVSHKLTLVGTDDGKSWFNVNGWCEGDKMTRIHFDFSPKGGPADIAAMWTKHDGKVHLEWDDGNTWVLQTPTNDSEMVTETTEKAEQATPVVKPKSTCNCACGGAGQCGPGCSSCDCEGCDPPKPKTPAAIVPAKTIQTCNCGCGRPGQCGAACHECFCQGCAA